MARVIHVYVGGSVVNKLTIFSAFSFQKKNVTIAINYDLFQKHSKNIIVKIWTCFYVSIQCSYFQEDYYHIEIATMLQSSSPLELNIEKNMTPSYSANYLYIMNESN